ncbi:MAG: PIN domain-containing protein [Acidobacteria bacterium]|nr:PIN domain-containing protein [Acidobacteriota bacterium]
MHAVDTNVLVRLLVRDDPGHVTAGERFVAKAAWVSHLVLTEATWVLDSVYGLGPKEIAVAVDMLLSHKDLAIHDANVVTAALGRFRKRPRIGFSDCLVLETARNAGHLPLGTFHRELGKLEGAQKL